MKILNAIGFSALLIVALMLGSTESFSQDPESASQVEESASQVEQSPSQADPCRCRGKYHTIQVRVDDDGNAVLKYRGGNGDSVKVCRGDNVRWVLIGENREFSVDFKYPNGAPFGNPPGEKRKRNSSDDEISVDIGMSAAGNDTTYQYDVGFANGEPSDPHIIVRN